jgi:hypothetical protein
MAQLVACRLAVRRARVRVPTRHPREVSHWAVQRWGNGEEPRRMFMDVRMCECIVYMKEKLINVKEWHQCHQTFIKFWKTFFFYKQILDFHCPSKIYVTHWNYEIWSKSLVPCAYAGGTAPKHSKLLIIQFLKCAGSFEGKWEITRTLIKNRAYNDPVEQTECQLCT